MYMAMEDDKTLADLWPEELMPTEEEKDEVNRLFKAYVFYRETSAGREVMCSCCGQHVRPDDRTIPPLYDADWKRHNDLLQCPFCGCSAEMKEIRHLGKRRRLEEYHPVVFLKEKAGNLWALAAWTRKNYLRELLEPPLYQIVGVYRFTPGRAEKWTPEYRDLAYDVIEGKYDPRKRPFNEPFIEGCGPGMYFYSAYTVLGMDAIERSAFRYCQYGEYRKTHACDGLHWNLMKYLSVASIYPREVEMLMKGGARDLVRDMVEGRKKNAEIFTWGAGDLRQTFRLDGQELRAWRESGASVYRIRDYKRLKKDGRATTFSELALCEREFSYHYDDFLKLAKKISVKPMKLYRYFDRQEGYENVREAFRDWEGYVKMAEKLEWTMDEETVRFPRQLRVRHDMAIEEFNLREKRERAREAAARRRADAKLVRQAKERMEKWREKYNFVMDGYIIRVAETPAEIRQEGQTLRHCVGGYAERHMAGKTTILFLRRKDAPDEPLATIEVSGIDLIQIRGYRNDAGQAPAKETYGELLAVWLDWLKRGSPRRKDGTPSIKRKEKKTA